MRSALFLGTLLCITSAQAQEVLTLQADSEPSNKPWKNPATISYSRMGDEAGTGTIDAYLKYQLAGPATGTTDSASQLTWSIGSYIHRDKGTDTPRNDRGIALGFSKRILTDSPNDGAPHSFEFSGKVTYGKTLEESGSDAGAKSYTDRTKDRETLYFSGYVQPAKTGPVPADEFKQPLDFYFSFKTGIYSDHSAGGSGSGTGRLTGTLAAADFNLFPFGLVAADNRIGDYGVTPVVTLSAQYERDAKNSGGRTKSTYKLYSATLTLEFDTIVGDKKIGRLKPSLNISRSVGADLLQGRAHQAKTEVSLGLTF